MSEQPTGHSIRCIVVVPVYKAELTADERISIRHLQRYLGTEEIAVVAPRGLHISALPYQHVEFDPEYFTGTDSYSKLLLSREFYAAFSGYDYMLVYQLDALVFDGGLDHWLGLGYDYIGAPLFNDMTNPDSGLSRVGNGGFSLRRIQAFLDVIDADRYDGDAPSILNEMLTAKLTDLDRISPLRRMKKKMKVLRAARMGSEEYRQHYTLNEDLFWSDRARLFHPKFTVAPVSTGLRFAFEQFPSYCHEQNGNQLPFGCHAWAKWDREFWMPYLLQE